MIIGLSDEQKDFADAVRDALTSACPPERLRDAPPASLIPEQLRVLGELGLLGAIMPESVPGGMGMGMQDVVAALESVGYAAPSGPWPEVLALGALLSTVATDQAAALSARIAAGEALVTGDLFGGRLVPSSAQSDALVMERAGGLVLLDDAGWETQAQPGLDPHIELATISWDARVDALAADAVDDDTVEWTRELGSVAIAAISCGIARRLLEMTTEYALQRHQFGVQIGSFQAIKHQIVDAHALVSVTRPNVWAAAWTVDQRAADASWRSSAVRVMADSALTKAARVALQVHGAIGFTGELPLSAWMKPAWSLGLRWGGTSLHASRMATTLFAEGPHSAAVGAGIRPTQLV